MMIRPNLRLAAMVLAILMISSKAGAQEPEPPGGTAQTTLEHGKVTGILTDQLNKSQLKAWKSIMEIVLAKDREGRLLHPELYGMYHQADASGHDIHIELSMQRCPDIALGWCSIPLQTGGTQKATALIHLNLGMIDRAVITKQSRRADGFIPLAGLGKKERYAEVLGHELAHAVRCLLNSDYLNRERKAKIHSDSQNGQDIERLTSLLEGPAEAAEKEVWRELTAGRGAKM